MTSPSGSSNARCKCGGFVVRKRRGKAGVECRCNRCDGVWFERADNVRKRTVEIERFKRRQKAKKKRRL